MSNLIKLILFLTLMTSLVNCGGFKKVDTRNTPVNAQERARKNVDEGRGTSINKIMKNRKGGNTSYEFSTSNPLWRASLETLDFLPMIQLLPIAALITNGTECSPDDIYLSFAAIFTS